MSKNITTEHIDEEIIYKTIKEVNTGAETQVDERML